MHIYDIYEKKNTCRLCGEKYKSGKIGEGDACIQNLNTICVDFVPLCCARNCKLERNLLKLEDKCKLTSKNPCFAQATWDPICLKKKIKKKQINK